MAIYQFETMTDAQGATYTAATDIIGFNTTGDTASQVTVLFQQTVSPSVPASATSTGSAGSTTVTGATLIDNVTGRAVSFGTGVFGESDFAFPDNSKLFVGTTGTDNVTFTGVSNDAMYGNLGNDSLAGGSGGDLLQGNQGNDSLAGNTGNDTIYGGSEDDTIDVGAGNNFAQATRATT